MSSGWDVTVFYKDGSQTSFFLISTEEVVGTIILLIANNPDVNTAGYKQRH